MELTRVFEKEELLNMQSYYDRNDCSRRTAKELISALLAEMDAPKVWDGAHEWQDRARVKHYSNSALCAMDETFKDYTRTLPKSRIDEIAEEAFFSMCDTTRTDDDVIDIIKYAILQARKEWEAER